MPQSNASEPGQLLGAWLGRLLGAAAGLAAGWFGILAGLLFGYMLDLARAEARERSRIQAYFRDPDSSPPPEEPYPGLAAAIALSAYAPWGDRESGTSVFMGLARRELPENRRDDRVLQRLADAAEAVPCSSLRALERALSLHGAPAVRAIVARFAYELQHKRGEGLDHRADSLLLLSLADCGLSGPEIEAARRLAFPSYRDPWAVLALGRGASYAEVRRAWRRLSRQCHPDLSDGEEGGEDAAARFRELQEAYEIIRGLRAL